MSVFVPYSILWGVVKFEGGGICPISVWKFLGGGFEVSGKMFRRAPHKKKLTTWSGGRSSSLREEVCVQYLYSSRISYCGRTSNE